MSTQFEYSEYLEVVAMSATAAKLFFGRTDEPVDLGPPSDVQRWKEGARVWGFKHQERPRFFDEEAEAIK